MGGQRASKAAVRRYATRVRDSLRGMERALRDDRLDDALDFANQATGEAGTAEQLIGELIDRESEAGS